MASARRRRPRERRLRDTLPEAVPSVMPRHLRRGGAWSPCAGRRGDFDAAAPSARRGPAVGRRAAAPPATPCQPRTSGAHARRAARGSSGARLASLRGARQIAAGAPVGDAPRVPAASASARRGASPRAPLPPRARVVVAFAPGLPRRASARAHHAARGAGRTCSRPPEPARGAVGGPRPARSDARARASRARAARTARRPHVAPRAEAHAARTRPGGLDACVGGVARLRGGDERFSQRGERDGGLDDGACSLSRARRRRRSAPARADWTSWTPLGGRAAWIDWSSRAAPDASRVARPFSWTMCGWLSAGTDFDLGRAAPAARRRGEGRLDDVKRGRRRLLRGRRTAAAAPRRSARVAERHEPSGACHAGVRARARGA